MKKAIIFVLMLSLAFSFTDCTRSNKHCKKNAKKIRNMRKNNPNFKV